MTMGVEPNARSTSSNSLVVEWLDDRLRDLEKATNADVLAYVGPIVFAGADAIRDVLDDRKSKRLSLAVVLETLGGYAEAAERIAETFRHHYQRVDFIIPNFAFSAGTILVMSGDAIHMDYYSVLGPIDPQVDKGERGFVPALGYLERFPVGSSVDVMGTGTGRVLRLIAVAPTPHGPTLFDRFA
ncbi:MAG: hypothetical protein WKG32_13205, partial [Gemmatimonadaceae bacterium]